MALDPSLIVQGSPGPPPPPKPFNPLDLADVYEKVQTLRTQAAVRNQQVADNAAINDAFSQLAQQNGGQAPDPFAVADFLTTNGNARAGNAVRQNALDQQKTMLANEQAQTKVTSDNLAFAGSQLQAARDNPAIYPTVKVNVEHMFPGLQLPDPADPGLDGKLAGFVASSQTTQQQLEAKAAHLKLVDDIQKGQGSTRDNAMKILAGATDPADYAAKLAHLTALTPPEYRDGLSTITPTWTPGQPNPALAAAEAGEKGVVIPQGGTLATPITGRTIATGQAERTMENYDIGGTNVRLPTDKEGRVYSTDGRPISPSPDGSWSYADGTKVDPRGLPKAPLPASVIVNAAAQATEPPVISDRPDVKTGRTVDPTTGLTQNAIYQNGLWWALTGQLQGVGMGNNPQRNAQSRAIQNSGAQMVSDAGTDLGTLRTDFAANKATLVKLLPRVTFTDTAMATANDNLDLALQHSADVPRTDSPLVNHYLNWANGDVLTGNPALTRFETDIYTAAREYAKVTSGSAAGGQAVTDSANREASKLLNAAQTPEAFQAAVKEMQADMRNVQGENIKAVNDVSSTIGGFLAHQTGVDVKGSTGNTGAQTPPKGQTRTLSYGGKAVVQTSNGDGTWSGPAGDVYDMAGKRIR